MVNLSFLKSEAIILIFLSVYDITDWKWMKIDEQQITSIYNGTHKAKFNQEAIS